MIVAYNQGVFVMCFFIVALLVLLAELLRQGLWSRLQGSATYAVAACGTLVGLMVEMIGAGHFNSPAIMAGWVIVGLGVAQLATRRGPAQPA
jgi:hypothetical protein